MVMAFDEGNLAPPPAPVARLPRLPSNTEIVCPRNTDVFLLILRAVLSRGAHRPGGNTYREVAALCGRTRLCVAGERLKPQRSPTRKRWLPVFPHFNQRAASVPTAQWKRSGSAADAQRMRGLNHSNKMATLRHGAMSIPDGSLMEPRRKAKSMAG